MATSSPNTVNQTIAIFDSFYNLNLVVSATEYDVVYSYFKSVSKNTTIAGNFTVVLFRIAQDGNYNVLDLLAIIKGANNKLQMNKVICYYLNTFKSKASMYGVSNVPKPNQAVQRNVVM